MSIRNIFLSILVIIVIATWYLSPAPTIEKRVVTEDVDYFIIDFDREKRGEDGLISSSFQAERVDHYPNDDRAELVQPRATTYSKNKSPWKMRADHGTQLNGRNLVKLKGGVVVKQNSTEDPKFSRMESEEVTILIDEEYLESDHPISFTTESSLTSSIGAQAWLKTGKIILLQESAGTYRSAIKKDNSDKGDDTSNNTTEK